ncbi:MAG: hypothetical protein CVU50_06090 [Candidatus Cloacimonetes bacterium HGW-Cloacimonetes-3]|jgi:hypothetical protein|nr:MAG: hypothetical protein CVU50_06090 [Candidatus Cloacimonetes bacterium HGW-Cloacimonetes-3]
MKHKNVLIIIILLVFAVSTFFAIPNSVKFDGLTGAPNEDHIAVGNLTAGVTTTYTAEAWIRPTQLTGGNADQLQYGYSVFASSTVVGGYPLWVTAKGTELNIWSYTSSAPVAHTTSGAGLTINNWYHIAVTAVKGGTTTVYVNGAVKLTYANENYGTWNNVFTIGVLRSSRTNSLIPFHGLIDEVRIWNVVRTQADIQADMYREIATVPASLKGYWQLNETVGNAPDLATPAHTGVLTNGASWNVPTGGAPFSEVTFSSTNPAVASAVIAANDTKVPAYKFTLSTTGLAATLTQLNFSTTGLYDASDLDNFKLWQNTADDLSTASLLGTINTGLGIGTHSFTSLTQTIANGTPRYLWITIDVSSTLSGSKSLTIPALNLSSFVYAASAKTGSAYDGGEQYSEEILPVELSSFTAVLTVENYVTVKWVTQSETGVGGYYVYRSLDSEWMNAIAISSMIPSANSPIQQVYQYTDSELEDDGIYYYWLQVQDLDGSTISHGPTSVNYSTGSGQETPGVVRVSGIQSIFPNPITPYSVINYNLTKATDVSFKIYNSRGQLVNSINDGYRMDGEYNTGWNGKDSKGNSCPTGIYFIKMHAGRDSSIRKAMIVN